MLTCKCFAADRADKWSFVGVSSQVRAQVVGSSEALRAQVTLESSRVFLCSSTVIGSSTRPLRIGQIQNVVAFN